MTWIEAFAPVAAILMAAGSAGFIYTKMYWMLPFTLALLLFEVIFMALSMYGRMVRQ